MRSGHEPRRTPSRAARVEMGSLEAVKDRVRDVGWESTVESVWQDVRYAVADAAPVAGLHGRGGRSRSRSASAPTLPFFRVAHAMLFQSLPYPQPQRLVAFVPAQKNQPSMAEPISHPTFLDWEEQSRSVESLAAYVVTQSTLTGFGDADAPVIAAVTPNIFSLLGAVPLVGRTLLPSDGNPDAARRGRDQRRLLARSSRRQT